MFTLYDNIKRLCDRKGVTPSKMCLDIGKSKSLISALKTGKTTGINRESAQLMAEYFGVSVDEVLHGIKEDPDVISDDEVRDELRDILTEMRDRSDLRMLFHATRDTTPDQIRAVVAMIEGFKNGGK